MYDSDSQASSSAGSAASDSDGDSDNSDDDATTASAASTALATAAADDDGDRRLAALDDLAHIAALGVDMDRSFASMRRAVAGGPPTPPAFASGLSQRQQRAADAGGAAPPSPSTVRATQYEPPSRAVATQAVPPLSFADAPAQYSARRLLDDVERVMVAHGSRRAAAPTPPVPTVFSMAELYSNSGAGCDDGDGRRGRMAQGAFDVLEGGDFVEAAEDRFDDCLRSARRHV